jgi:hypothetical protein
VEKNLYKQKEVNKEIKLIKGVIKIFFSSRRGRAVFPPGGRGGGGGGGGEILWREKSLATTTKTKESFVKSA